MMMCQLQSIYSVKWDKKDYYEQWLSKDLGGGGFGLFQGAVLQIHGKTEENHFHLDDDTFFEMLADIFSLSHRSETVH